MNQYNNKHKSNYNKSNKHRPNFKARSESSIINIRTFHNLIKRELIKQTVQYYRENYANRKIKLLDLSCGKGGDIQKWYDNRIMFVIGFDIDNDSIQEANVRYNGLINRLQKAGVIDLPIYKFYQMDLSKPENIDKIKMIIGDMKFDIVSCQFAIHYFFESKLTLDTFITIVSSYIEKNGFFISTTMNGIKLKKLFASGDTVSNRLFKITNKSVGQPDALYGLKYSVELGESTDTEHYFAGKSLDEYIVDIDRFKEVMKAYGLMFIGTVDFEDWYQKITELQHDSKLLNDQEKEFSFLNFSMVFSYK